MDRYHWKRMLGAAMLLAMLATGSVTVPQVGAGAAGRPQAVPSTLSWNIETVDAAKAFRSMEDRSLALDAAGHPHIAYGDDSLYYAWHDGLDWHYETVDTANDVGEHAALDLDAQGRPHISYYDRWTGSLRYAFGDGESWRIHIVEGIGTC